MQEHASQAAGQGFDAGKTIIGHVSNSPIDHPLIHLPPVFGKTNKVGAPAGAIWIVAAIASLLVLASSSKNFVALYVFITLVSTVAALVLYVVCAAAALKLKVIGKWAIIGVIGVIYSIAMFIGAGWEATLWGFGLAIAGLPVRAISRWLNGSSRRAATSPAAPPE